MATILVGVSRQGKARRFWQKNANNYLVKPERKESRISGRCLEREQESAIAGAQEQGKSAKANLKRSV